jgi:hypothetical protein
MFLLPLSVSFPGLFPVPAASAADEVSAVSLLSADCPAAGGSLFPQPESMAAITISAVINVIFFFIKILLFCLYKGLPFMLGCPYKLF